MGLTLVCPRVPGQALCASSANSPARDTPRCHLTFRRGRCIFLLLLRFKIHQKHCTKHPPSSLTSLAGSGPGAARRGAARRRQAGARRPVSPAGWSRAGRRDGAALGAGCRLRLGHGAAGPGTAEPPGPPWAAPGAGQPGTPAAAPLHQQPPPSPAHGGGGGGGEAQPSPAQPSPWRRSGARRRCASWCSERATSCAPTAAPRVSARIPPRTCCSAEGPGRALLLMREAPAGCWCLASGPCREGSPRLLDRPKGPRSACAASPKGAWRVMPMATGTCGVAGRCPRLPAPPA